MPRRSFTIFDLLIFDLDNTLLDFDQAERAGVAAVCRSLQHEFTELDFADYRRINLALWKTYSAGKMDKAQILKERFLQFFVLKHLDGDPDAANLCFLKTLCEESFLLSGAKEILHDLKGNIPMGVITNGHGPTQRKRLFRSAIEGYFDFVLISDEFGLPKPNPAIFIEGLRLGKSLPKRTLMVGDCLVNDIGGARKVGINTCWLSEKAERGDGGIVADWTISNISELRGILKPSS